MPTSTTRYSFQKPTVGGDTDNWGTLLNENWDSADTNLYSVQTTANAALPKAGGEMTGDITFNSDNAHDIGTSSKAAQKIYSDAVQTDTITNQATSGGLTVDVDGDIVLDADGGDLEFKDAGTSILKISNSSSDVVVQPQVADKDIIFKEDGGTEIARFDSSAQSLKLASGKKVEFADTGEHISSNGTDLTLAAGADINLTATTDINIPADVGLTFGNDGEKIEGDGTDLTVTSSNDLTLDAAGDITLSADGDQVKMDDGTTTRFQVDTASGDVTMTDSAGGASLGPELSLYRDSSDATNTGDEIGAVSFKAEDSGSNVTTYAQVKAVVRGVTDTTEDGDLQLQTMNNGTLTTALTVKSDGDLEVGDGKYIGSTTTPTAIQIEADGDVKLAGDLIVNDLVMQNDRGHYRLVEEEDFIRIVNEKTGKSYKLLMEEIDA